MTMDAMQPTTTLRLTMGPAPDDGRSAWLLTQREVDARVGGPVKSSNVERQQAAERAIDTIESLHADARLYGIFKLLAAADLFRFSRLERTRTLAWALWYVRHCERNGELAPEWLVPEATVNEALGVRARVARVAVYHLEDHPEDGVLVKSVNGSLDRREIGNQLQTLREVCERHHDILSSDRKWSEDDFTRLGVLTQEFVRALGRGERAGWAERGAVLLELLLDEYKDVRETGRWILRAQPVEAVARFPGLVPSRRTKAAGTKGEAEGEDTDAKPEGDAPDTE